MKQSNDYTPISIKQGNILDVQQATRNVANPPVTEMPSSATNGTSKVANPNDKAYILQLNKAIKRTMSMLEELQKTMNTNFLPNLEKGKDQLESAGAKFGSGLRDILRRIGNPGQSVTLKDILTGFSNDRGQAQRINDLNTERQLAKELYVLAQKADDPRQLGSIEGGIYTIKTLGPGRVQLQLSATGETLLEVRQRDFLSFPEITRSPEFSSSEMQSTLALVQHINRSIGDEGISTWLAGKRPQDVYRILAGFTPTYYALSTQQSIINIATQRKEQEEDFCNSNPLTHLGGKLSPQPFPGGVEQVGKPIEMET